MAGKITLAEALLCPLPDSDSDSDSDCGGDGDDGMDPAMRVAGERDADAAVVVLPAQSNAGVAAAAQPNRGAAAPGPPAVVGTKAYDMWCFGVMLFQLCTGRVLFDMDTREDVTDAELAKIAEWADATKAAKLAVVTDPWPRALLEQLLAKDPRQRLVSLFTAICALHASAAAACARRKGRGHPAAALDYSID